MTTLLAYPDFWLILLICAPYDYMKLIPLLVILAPRSNYRLIELLEFLALATGDVAMIMVKSFKDKEPLFIGVLAFNFFVISRIITEVTNFPSKRKWPWLLFFTTALLLIDFYPIKERFLQTYVISLATLLSVRWSRDYSSYLFLGDTLYVLSDCLLLISLNHRFPGDWIIGRIVYWSSLALIYT